MKNFIVRQAISEDLEALHSFFLSLPESSPFILRSPQDTQPDLERRRAWLHSILGQISNLLLVAVHQEKLIGALFFERGSGKKTRHKGTISISVLSPYRSKGVGATLMNEFIGWLSIQDGLIKVDASVMAKNTACLKLLAKHGFRPIAVIPQSFLLDDGDFSDEHLLQKILCKRSC